MEYKSVEIHHLWYPEVDRVVDLVQGWEFRFRMQGVGGFEFWGLSVWYLVLRVLRF